VGPAHSQESLDAVKVRAESGDVRAQVQLGMAYAAGDGVQVDQVQAVNWFRKAAGSGNLAAQYYLGEMYLSGRGVPIDAHKASRWIQRAALGGDPRAAFNLSVLMPHVHALKLGVNGVSNNCEPRLGQRKAEPGAPGPLTCD
jgi:hypothetical protein